MSNFMEKETVQQRHYRYVILAVCLIVTFINYLDRSIISYAIAPIQHDLGLNNALFGLTISAFALGTLTVNGVAGVIVDHFSPRIIWPIAIVFWSLVMISLGLAQTFLIFMILRYFLGIGEGINFPTLDRALLDWITPNRISTVMAYALLGVPLANLVGGPLLAHMIIHFHWRVSFIILGFIGLATVFLWIGAMFWYRFPKQPFREKVDQEKKAQALMMRRHSFMKLLKDPSVLAISWAFFAFGYVLFFAISWLPGYLEQIYHLHLRQIGWFLMLPWGLACVLILVGGFLSDYLMKKTNRSRVARIYLIAICQLISVLFFIPPVLIHSVTVALVCISFAIGFALMPNAAFYSACSDISKLRAGTATGIMVSFFSLSGIVSPAVTGLLSDWFGNFSAAISVLIVVVVTSILGLLFFAHPDKALTSSPPP